MHAARASKTVIVSLLGAAVIAGFGFRITLPAGAAQVPETQTAVLAGGCFWGLEGVFEALKGVRHVVAGYSGGSALSAHYEIVSTGLTGHAESVSITYDPREISYASLLKVYFLVAHDPTESNRQGPDYGPQYRSEIFYTSNAQKNVAQLMIRRLTDAKAFSAPIVTEVAPLRAFYAAEPYHQHYMALHPNDPYIATFDAPKLDHLKADFSSLLGAKS
ncbi:MAG: peptide-methionine (S)-S-oxide reductase MsrA [Candidatus Eremiobacteraeota bacterium]|nr:peptide-methionine (S)-S-oxide reductase MsrA [Candidatus Eremiobacteraeota bacterium]MBC5804584.1 peptide-methionine (S)-S-oxide reductase MsrA [Candidatus Eremiobacteraeota bacterium]MBC5822062.1 peptide-methionine (S)-S-oxide reductase MsrA [Candidatus Eremiobacteraeota bacterium]